MIRRAVYSLLMLLPILAEGHHSNAGYDFSAIEELAGDLVRIAWQNPHVRMTLRTTSGEDWELEAQDINSLGRRGLSVEMLDVGDTVRVAGHPLRRGGRTLFVTNVLLPSGVEIHTRGEGAEPRWADTTIGFGGPDIEAAQNLAGNQQGIFRVWMVREFGFLPTDLPLTSTAQAARDAWDPADSLVEKCIAAGMPSAVGVGGPHPIELTQGDGVIVYRAESFDIVRTIYVDPERFDELEAPSALGYSVGRWEGDTLVVRTTQINWPYLNSEGSIPQSGNVETIERFSVDEANDHLSYILTIIDPGTLTAPVTAEAVLEWRPDLIVEPYECRLYE